MNCPKVSKSKLGIMANMNQSMTMSNDYCGFLNFPDGLKFKYNEEGDICIATDCSTWAKKLVDNMPLSEYLESEGLVPPEVLHFPEFGTRERRKKRKESIGNYIENCEYCSEHMDMTFKLCGNLVCSQCNYTLKNYKCKLCNKMNMFAEQFRGIYEYLDTDNYSIEQTFFNIMKDSCKCYDHLPYYFHEEDDYGEGCRVCRGYTAGEGDICYYCRVGL